MKTGIVDNDEQKHVNLLSSSLKPAKWCLDEDEPISLPSLIVLIPDGGGDDDCW